MGYVWSEQQTESAVFLKDKDNQISVEFSDPTYVRADRVLFDAATRGVHIVLHESIFAVGTVPEEMGKRFGADGGVMLYANHYAGNRVGLRAPVLIV